MFALVTVIAVGNAPVANLLKDMAALPLISASTILKSLIFALVTVIAVGNAPVASFDKAIAALAFMSAFTIAPSAILALVTALLFMLIAVPLLDTVTSPLSPSGKLGPCGP